MQSNQINYKTEFILVDDNTVLAELIYTERDPLSQIESRKKIVIKDAKFTFLMCLFALNTLIEKNLLDIKMVKVGVYTKTPGKDFKEIYSFTQLLRRKNMFSEDEKNLALPYELNTNYFIRTVTHHYTGKLIAVYPKEIVLSDAAWIADDGRFHDAVKLGTFKEVEPYVNNIILNRSAILDATKIDFELPREQK